MKGKEIQIVTDSVEMNTQGAGDLLDITQDLTDLLKKSRLSEGTMTVFVGGSTAGITTIEYEGGLIQDMREFYEKIAPSNRRYHHMCGQPCRAHR